MNDYDKLRVREAIQALNIKITDLQREVGSLRQDIRRLLTLVESQRERMGLFDQLDSADLENG